MKISDLEQNIITQGNLKSIKCTAEWTGHAAKILSDTLYSDKIKAIIRELSTNAWDSHVESKNLTPFSVHLPTLESPKFIIRDFGTGLSNDHMLDLYTVYFKSTKQNSNEFNGTFGVGRMCFLSYNTKSCTIESYKDGIVRTYTMYYGQDSVPVLTSLSESPTTEPNGVKITVPVKQSDISTFKQKAEQVYKWFDVKPNFTGNIPKIEPDIIDIQGQDFYIYKSQKTNTYYSNNYAEPLVVMGNVAYPLKLETQNKKLLAIQKQNLVIRAPIGSVNFDIGREKLSYNDSTIKYLTDKLESIVNELSKDLQTEVDKCKCKYDAIVKYWESPIKEILKIQYDGKVLPESIFGMYNNMTVRPKIMVYDKNSLKAWSTRDIKYQSGCIFLERDKNDVRPRIQDLINTNTVYAISFDNDKDKETWLKEVGLLSIEKLSNYKPKKLPKVPGQTITTKRPKYVGKQFNYNKYSWNVRKCWDNIEELPKDYVLVKLDTKTYNSDINFNKLKDIHIALQSVGIKPIPVIGQKEDVPDDKHFKTWLKKEVEKKYGKSIKTLSGNFCYGNVSNVIKKRFKINILDSYVETLIDFTGIKKEEENLKKYPLLEHIYSAPEKMIEQYIDLVDRCPNP
jgi:hypothetical protein